MEKAQQDKQSAIIRAEGEAQSATLIGQAIKDNPSFLTLRCVGWWNRRRDAAGRATLRGGDCRRRSQARVLLEPLLPPPPENDSSSPNPTPNRRRIEAAREIAQTVATSGNRMMLPADSLLLNMSGVDTSVKRK